MIITKIEEGKRKNYRVFSDEVFLFSLYEREIKQFGIVENIELSNDVIHYILDSVIYKRAKERALFLLEKKPYSIHMMKTQLLKNEYPLEIINKVLSFLMEYHYLDDADYTRMYINSYSGKKSKKQLLNELYCRGINRETIEEYFEKNEYSENNSFVNQFEKYIKGKDLQDYLTRQKVFAYFYRKGFSSTLIESYIRNAIIK